MRIAMLSNEYPPHIYGGAGVHVEHLCRELARLAGAEDRIQVLCFGDQRENTVRSSVTGIPAMPDPGSGPSANHKVIDALGRNIVMARLAAEADLVHCHTWYSYLAGCLIKQFQEIPMLVTVHSLEPKRPWKREQIGKGYHVSSWLEKTAMQNADGIIAVSQGMKDDILEVFQAPAEKIRVIYNGIDTAVFRRTSNPEVLASYGIDPAKPYMLFVGRITRQKGIVHLVRALPWIDAGVQIVLCAGAPDTEEIAQEMAAAVDRARAATANPILWIPGIVPVERLVALYSHAAVFVCPSVYEPFGIINLEAMACGIPVAAAAVGGLPEVVVHGLTGLLVPIKPASRSDPEPESPEDYARSLAAAVNELMRAPERRRAMGAAARRRVEAQFGWEAIARQTLSYYAEVCAAKTGPAKREGG